jgi:hypothetical protein
MDYTTVAGEVDGCLFDVNPRGNYLKGEARTGRLSLRPLHTIQRFCSCLAQTADKLANNCQSDLRPFAQHGFKRLLLHT